MFIFLTYQDPNRMVFALVFLVQYCLGVRGEKGLNVCLFVGKRGDVEAEFLNVTVSRSCDRAKFS